MAQRPMHPAFLTLLATMAMAACGGEADPVAGVDSGASADAAVVAPDASDANDGSLAEPDAGSGEDASLPGPDGSVAGPDAGMEDASVPGPDGSVSDGGLDPCDPNPCTDVEGHRTRCLWDGEGGFECRCEVGLHDSEGLCCPPHSAHQQGACACVAGYVDDGGGACVVACSEESIEGLNGWCPEGEVCVQGACVADLCDGFACPARSTCVLRANEPFCLCEEGLHLSQDLCCPLHASNVDGACACDPGYVDQAGACVADPSNPCFPTNPCRSLHRNTCVADGAAAGGFRCECNQGYEEQGGACVLSVWTSCPAGLVCRAQVCVPQDLSQEQCLVDSDCHEFFPDAPSFCNESAAGGICLGCVQHTDCPGNTQCTSYGSCALLCDDDGDCPYGRCYSATGFCGQTRCSADTDCFNGTVCIDEDGNGQGLCLRVPCLETECSSTHPNGTCPQPGQACLYGACVDSCSPNPCTQELNKTVCTIEGGAPVCSCAPGYALAADGRCLPEAAECPSGFACSGGVCADTSNPGFVCAQDSDCGGGLVCSPALPSGSCQGCSLTAPCPAGLDCVSGYCLKSCSRPSDCHPEMTCRGSGYCGRKACASPADCAAPYVCVAGADGGTCRRPVCTGP